MDPEIERKWQEKWEKAGIFSPSDDPSKEKFFITVPWPYSNGSLHVGHGRTYSLSDVIARYKRLSGYNVLFPMAFHQSGTPILAYSERIRRGDEESIRQYKDYLREYENEEDIRKYLKEFEKPENIASYFSDRIVKDFKSLGFSIDWSRKFTSAEPFYQEFVRWQFNHLFSKGMIKQGKYPILYSIEDQNAVGEDDIKDGDTDKVSIEEFTGVIFSGKDFDLVAASLRPETLFGVTNIWVATNESYVSLKYQNRMIVVAEKALEKLLLQNPDLEVAGHLTAADITGKRFRVPISGSEVPVFAADFVDPENGTGIVFSVPGHSVWDHVAIKDLSLPLKDIEIIEYGEKGGKTLKDLLKEFNIVSSSDADGIREATSILYREEFYSGKMNGFNGPFSNLSVREAREAMQKEILKDSGFIVYETSRKATTRSGSRVTVAVLRDQWFIDYSEKWLKDLSHEAVDNMLFEPLHYKSGMHEVIDWLKQRPCARRRGIGTHLPFDTQWIIESLSDSTIYPAVYTNSTSLREIYNEVGSLPDDLLDYVFLGTNLPEGKYPGEIKRKAGEARKSFEYWYAVDIRLTTNPHLTNHLAFYIMNHAAIFPRKYWPKGIVISGLVTSEGAKISKSKGNAISLLKIANNYSSDIYRLFSAINSDTTSVLDWNEGDLSLVRKKYDAFVSIMDSYRDHGVKELQNIEKWFLVSFNDHVRDYFRKMDQFNIRGAYISIFYEVLNDLKHVESRGGDPISALRSVIRDWIVLMSPVIPHTCEEIWEKMGNHGFVSTEVYIPLNEEIDRSPLIRENYIEKLVSDIRGISRATGIEPGRIRIHTASPEIERAAKIMMDGNLSAVPAEMKRLIPDFMKNRKNISLEVPEEAELISSEKKYLENLFRCDIEISMDPGTTGRSTPWPGRPSIELIK